MPDVFSPKKESQTVKAVKDSIDSLKEQSLAFFTTYAELPKGINFENQEEEETILVFLRRHPITNLPWIIISLILFILPIFLPFFLPSFLEAISFIDITIPQSFIAISLAFYYVLILGFALLSFVSWFYNISIVTDNEVVDIDYSHVTYKNIATTNLREIQDVEYIQKGFLQTFFNYGDVFVQTAGAHPNVEFLRIPNPARVNDIIMDEKRRVVGHA